MAQLGLYYQTQLDTKVSLLPDQINANMDQFILENLRAKIEKKTIDQGIVLQINRLIDYDYGMIDKSNFMGTTVFNVKYECFICSPVKNLEIVCVLDNIIKGYLIGHNGPIIVAIQINNIDTQKFEINGDNIVHIKTRTTIKKNDYLKVFIINVTTNLGEPNIVTICKLLDFADKDEIKRFQEDQQLAKGGSADDKKVFI